MADLSEFLNRTTALIDQYYERNQRTSFKKYISMSELGDECPRKLWYLFRWYLKKAIVPGRVQRIFDTGQEQENRVIKGLSSFALVGNCQQRVEACNGHAQGAIDGEIVGLPEAKSTVHLLEVKSHNDKNFKLVEKLGVERGFFKHYVQMSLYGYLRGLTRYIYIAINKNDEAIFQERGEINATFAKAQLDRAQRIIDATEPPTRIAGPDSFECKFCEAYDICHRGKPHDVNERNDGSMKPGPGGVWVRTQNISTTIKP